MVDINYEFDGDDGYPHSFSYEIDYKDADDYIIRTHGYDEILNDYLQYLYPDESKRDKETVKEYGFDGTKESIYFMEEEQKEDLAEQVVGDLINLDLYNEELKDYFEDEAYEAFKDSQEYNKDPYAYYGLRRSDFY